MPPLLWGVPTLASAQIPVVRDAETEALLLDYLKPILKAAGIQAPEIRLIPDDTFNAFVTGNGNLFVNTGAITASETPNELIGVLAHETGHMAHNDIAALRQQIDDTKRAALIAGLVGIGAAVAGSAAGSDVASGDRHDHHGRHRPDRPAFDPAIPARAGGRRRPRRRAVSHRHRAIGGRACWRP